MSLGVRTETPAYLPIIVSKVFLPTNNIEVMLNDYSKFMRINLQLSKTTVIGYRSLLRKFLKTVFKNPITRTNIRDFLEAYSNDYPNKYSYANMLKVLKVFFREYLNSNIMKNFKFPKIGFSPKIIPTKEALQRFYYAIDSAYKIDLLKQQTLFLMFATSGQRRNEILGLYINDIDLENKMLVPKMHTGVTKKSWVGFFNEECKQKLLEYLDYCRNNYRCRTKRRLFNFWFKDKSTLWKSARQKTSLRITPQTLRQWFSVEMAEKGVQDRYVNAFTGKTPKSVLERYYTDYSPERLKKIYDKADIHVLE